MWFTDQHHNTLKTVATRQTKNMTRMFNLAVGSSCYVGSLLLYSLHCTSVKSSYKYTETHRFHSYMPTFYRGVHVTHKRPTSISIRYFPQWVSFFIFIEIWKRIPFFINELNDAISTCHWHCKTCTAFLKHRNIFLLFLWTVCWIARNISWTEQGQIKTALLTNSWYLD